MKWTIVTSRITGSPGTVGSSTALPCGGNLLKDSA